MGKTADMFEDLKPPRARPQKLMHVCDAGGNDCDDEMPLLVRYSCKRCGHETEWLDARTVTEAKRGIPCPQCNMPSNARDQAPQPPETKR